MPGGFQFNRQPMQNAWGGQNNSARYQRDNNNNGPGNNSGNGQQQGGNNPNGQFNRNYNTGGFNQGPSFNSYGKSDGPMDPPRSPQNSGRQGQGPPGQPPRVFSPGPPGQPPRLFSPPPPGHNNNRPGSISNPPQGSPGQPQRVLSPGPRSPTGNLPGSLSGPPAGGQQRPNPFPQGLGYDPARSQGQTAPSSWITNRRIDLPAAAYIAGEGVSSSLDAFVMSIAFVRWHIRLSLILLATSALQDG
jgi:hypothetical protein